MLTNTITIIVTKQQILDFANLTGDNSSIHLVDGIVQSGLILSMLPQWSNVAKDDGNFILPNNNITSKFDCKFRNPLFADTPYNITFTYEPLKLQFYKITWQIEKNCSGVWIIRSLS